MPKPLTQRVVVDGYCTDGHNLYQVDRISPLGSVDLRDASTHAIRTVGIDAFRRRFWLVKGGMGDDLPSARQVP